MVLFTFSVWEWNTLFGQVCSKKLNDMFSRIYLYNTELATIIFATIFGSNWIGIKILESGIRIFPTNFLLFFLLCLIYNEMPFSYKIKLRKDKASLCFLLKARKASPQRTAFPSANSRSLGIFKKLFCIASQSELLRCTSSLLILPLTRHLPIKALKLHQQGLLK